MIEIFGLLLIVMVLGVKFCKKKLKILLSIIIILATIYSVMIGGNIYDRKRENVSRRIICFK